MDNRAILNRIDSELARLGVSESRAAAEAGLDNSAIRKLRKSPETLPSLRSIELLARRFDCTPEWLTYAVGDNRRSAKGLPLVGAVSGGVWREIDSLDQDEQPPSPFLPDPRWPADKQFALRVEGESINRIARDGDLIAVVAVEALEKPPANGALVIVEEARDDGALIRTTAKRLHARGKLAELHADSDDPRWRDVRLIIEPDTGDARLITTRIVGLVTAVHRTLG